MKSVNFVDQTVEFRGKFSPQGLSIFSTFMHRARDRGFNEIILDFQACTGAYPNSMVPTIAQIQKFISEGFKTKCILPIDENLRRLF